MRDNPEPTNKFADSNTCAAARQSASSVLLDRAQRLRREAGELHKEADRVEQLGHYAGSLSGQAEEAMWRLAINYIDRAAPRPY